MSQSSKAKTYSVIGIMVICMLLQGSWMFLRDAFTQHLPLKFFISDALCTLSLIAAFFYARWPAAALICGWATLVVFVVLLNSAFQESSIGWTMVHYSMPLIYLLAAHLGLIGRRNADDLSRG